MCSDAKHNAIIDKVVISPLPSPQSSLSQSPDHFNLILDLYRLGKFHVSDSGCALVLQSNIQYWRLDELWIESCCSLQYYPQLEVCQSEKSGDVEAKKMAEQKMKEENFGTSKFGRFRSWLWDTIEYPWSSNTAQLLGKSF